MESYKFNWETIEDFEGVTIGGYSYVKLLSVAKSPQLHSAVAMLD
ncbi:MAG: hypothetical protein OFPI_18360 [Osedax symbiont Rs2]|nr:MAG: hypothetical protein OFPI_18360 [Osedax symbiont Rs2]